MSVIFAAGLLHAETPVVYVSGSGVDSDACTLTAPCRQISQALAQVAAGGNVIVIESGDFTPFVINKAVSITAPDGVVAVIQGTRDLLAVDVQVADQGRVSLKGVTVNGIGGSTNCSHSIRLAAGSLSVEGVTVRRSCGAAIFAAAPAKDLAVLNTVIDGSNGGIYASNLDSVRISDVKILRIPSGSKGIDIRGGPAILTGVEITGTNSAGSGTHTGLSVATSETRGAQVFVERSSILNMQTGILTDTSLNPGLECTARVSNSVVTANGIGLFTSLGGAIVSGSNNAVVGNTSDGNFTSTYPVK